MPRNGLRRPRPRGDGDKKLGGSGVPAQLSARTVLQQFKQLSGFHRRKRSKGGVGWDQFHELGINRITVAKLRWPSESVRRGVDYLLETQNEDGTWDEPWFTGTGFPKVFFLRYQLYPIYFPLMALARFGRSGY